MKSKCSLTGLMLLALSVGLWGAASHAQQDPPPEGAATKAGETLDEVGRAIKRSLVDAEESLRDGLNKTGATVREGFAKTRDSVQGMGLIPRVYGPPPLGQGTFLEQLVRQGRGRCCYHPRHRSRRGRQGEGNRARQGHGGSQPSGRAAHCGVAECGYNQLVCGVAERRNNQLVHETLTQDKERRAVPAWDGCRDRSFPPANVGAPINGIHVRRPGLDRLIARVLTTSSPPSCPARQHFESVFPGTPAGTGRGLSAAWEGSADFAPRAKMRLIGTKND